MDSRFSVIRRDRNVGLSTSRNTGISVARGDYITFLDGDDFMFPDTLGPRLETAQDTDPLIVGSWCDWVSVKENVGLDISCKSKSPRNDKLTISYTTARGENQVISSSPIIKLEIVKRLDGYDSEFRTAEDFDFITRLFRNGFKLKSSGVVGIAYRQKRESMVVNDPVGHLRNAMKIYSYMKSHMEPESVCDLSTHAFVDPPAGIPNERKRFERIVTFLTLTVLAEGEQNLSDISDMLTTNLNREDIPESTITERIQIAMRRNPSLRRNITKSQRNHVDKTVRRLIEDYCFRNTKETKDNPYHIGSLIQERLAHLGQQQSRIRKDLNFTTRGPLEIVLTAKSPDAARELLLVGRELVELGYSVAMINDCISDFHIKSEGVTPISLEDAMPKLLISSDGDRKNLNYEKHFVLSCEPILTGEIFPDVDAAHIRGEWESHLFPQHNSRIVDWHTRQTRNKSTRFPSEGQKQFHRREGVYVFKSEKFQLPTAEDFKKLLPDENLFFSPEFLDSEIQKKVSSESQIFDLVRLRTVAPYLKALVCPTSSIPTDALDSGTPIIVVSNPESLEAPSSSEQLFIDIPRLLSTASISYSERTFDEDPLQIHIQQCIDMLSQV